MFFSLGICDTRKRKSYNKRSEVERYRRKQSKVIKYIKTSINLKMTKLEIFQIKKKLISLYYPIEIFFCETKKDYLNRNRNYVCSVY